MNDADAGEVDFVSLGCPHLSIEEIARIAELLEGKQVTKEFWITTARPTKQIADRMGYTQIIEASGAKFAADTCCVVAPIRGRFHALATDSAKACYYACAKNRFKTVFQPFDEVVMEALQDDELQGRKIYPGHGGGRGAGDAHGHLLLRRGGPGERRGGRAGHELEGQSIAGKVLVFPTGKGSTVGSYTLYRLKHNGKAPAAIVNAECETITAVGCIIAEIPCVDQIPIERIQTGCRVRVDGEAGAVEVLE